MIRALPLALVALSSPLGGTLPAVAPPDIAYLLEMRSPGLRGEARSGKVRLTSIANIHTFEKPADPITAVPVLPLSGSRVPSARPDQAAGLRLTEGLATLSIDIPDLSGQLIPAARTLPAGMPLPDIIIPRVPERPVVSAVPDASTWACMVVGFGVIGLALRKKELRSEHPAT